jgi:hypothetical protein
MLVSWSEMKVAASKKIVKIFWEFKFIHYSQHIRVLYKSTGYLRCWYYHFLWFSIGEDFLETFYIKMKSCVSSIGEFKLYIINNIVARVPYTPIAFFRSFTIKNLWYGTVEWLRIFRIFFSIRSNHPDHGKFLIVFLFAATNL